ncbi:Outer membrane lipoprotein SmpA [Methylophaga frappieri]|uniref:Outer membrane protein assembly factor BamE n=1 Tax=Methylophaga frappieri (strain ATCC BAA-2434 / DSM 25690 / JAM7) TaxID=754477 RepID=I1YGY4_METFJ|nr:outer membrane protein assembly factor BamE [Methylophaga frappieri]AFJ02177.1 Outer membrane lipoprotein SmpA [Methylophaga frappieri]
MKSLIIYSLSAVFLFLGACSKDKIPGVYRIDIQQGNDVTQEMLAKLEPGMSKSQVNFVMGTPVLIDTFHPDRWDYIYSYQPGNGNRQQRRVTLFFEDDKLLYIDGNTRVVEQIQMVEEERSDTNVVVPLTEPETSFFGSLLNLIGLGDDEAEFMETDTTEVDPALESQAESLPTTSQTNTSDNASPADLDTLE